VTAADQPDRDSIPGNNDPYEDDQASASVCPTAPPAKGRMTGGGSAFLTDPGQTPAASPTNPIRITHGFELHCATPAPDVNNHLEINWVNAAGAHVHFHLNNLFDKGGGDGLLDVICLNDSRIDPAPPPITAGGPDTMIGYGIGLYTDKTLGLNKAPAEIIFVFNDAGEPGVNDKAGYYIRLLSSTATGPGIPTGKVVLDTNSFPAADIGLFGTQGGSAAIKAIARDLYNLTPLTLNKGNHQVHLELKHLLDPTVPLSSAASTVAAQLAKTFSDWDGLNLNGQGLENKLDNLNQDLLAEAASFEAALGGATVSGTAFKDANHNGTLDLGETGLGGITVQLYTSLGTLVGTTTTASDGSYSFNVGAGTYYVVFKAPGYHFSTAPANSDPDVSSDVNTAGITALFSLSPGQIADMLNAGIY
jgi:hypothetical protein